MKGTEGKKKKLFSCAGCLKKGGAFYFKEEKNTNLEGISKRLSQMFSEMHEILFQPGKFPYLAFYSLCKDFSMVLKSPCQSLVSYKLFKNAPPPSKKRILETAQNNEGYRR